MKLIKSFLFDNPAEPIIKTNNIFITDKFLEFHSFGKINQNKIFYVIKRTPGAGMFSNLTFVMNHLLIAHQHNFIPVVDMLNFPTIYNEKNKIDGTLNAWEYYFEPVSRYSLEEVYKSKNVLITSNKFEKYMSLDLFDKKFKKVKNKIVIKKKILELYKREKSIKFKNEKKILGIHFRGTTYKVARNHSFPLNKSLMKENIDNLMKKYKYNKIFLVTEEKNYINFFKKNYENKLIYCDSFRSSREDAFQIYPRKLHRYKLGKEIFIETLLLAQCKGITYVKSNVSSAAIFFSKAKLKTHPLFIGYNSRNKYIAKWLWYLKNLLPKNFGGLKLNN